MPEKRGSKRRQYLKPDNASPGSPPSTPSQVQADPSHILHLEFELLPSGKRFRLPQCKLNRLKNSFVLHSISLLNKHGGR
ncbi:hypothetical protein AAFF_G00398880 [Aldrovandia affinis]|uniref:Uncharacterized protein n=1 Tax=Aldrovandia affinis TaxID=143900 RepID=A0AAD7SCT4_9TELE|nr:hypothetical protein AAFF_G00398880 [Aldrovandia affinis]